MVIKYIKFAERPRILCINSLAEKNVTEGSLFQFVLTKH